MKNLKTVVGCIAVLVIVLLNLSYAYRGYGFSNDELLKGILAEESSSGCGIDASGNTIWCKEKMDVVIFVPCPVITISYFKDKKYMGDKVTNSDKSISYSCEYPYNSFSGYTRTELHIDPVSLPSLGIECPGIGGEGCSPKKPSTDCSAIYWGRT